MQWLAIGTALGGLAWLLPWTFFKTNEPETFYILSYTRNTGMMRWPDSKTADPAAVLANVSDYPVQIAVRCKIASWTIATNSNVTDVDESARLRFSENSINDHTFNCLSDFLRPPYVRLERGPDLPLNGYVTG